MGRGEGGHFKEKDTPTGKSELEGTETGARQAPEIVNHLVLLKHRERVGEPWGMRLQQQGGTILWYGLECWEGVRGVNTKFSQ